MSEEKVNVVRQEVNAVRQEVNAVRQEVKTLEAEKARLFSDIQRIYVDDFKISSRGMIEYAENWMMTKKEYNSMSRVEKWTNYLSEDPVGKRIFECTLQKNKLWVKSAKDMATRIEGFHKIHSDGHHLTAHMIDEKKQGV